MVEIKKVSVYLVMMMLLLPAVMILQKKFPRTLRILKACILIVYLLVSLYLTLLSRTPYGNYSVNLMPFWSYIEVAKGDQWTGIQIILNILLYIPMGYLLHFIFPRLKVWHVILIGCVASILTETAQYAFKLGTCEFDDVFHNTLGTIVGVGAYWGMKKAIRIIGYWQQRKQAK